MKKITNVTNEPKQKLTLQTENGEDIEFYLTFEPRVQSWFFSFKYKDKEANNLQVVLHPNILRQFRRIIPFGIGFMGNTKAEPFNINAFITGACSLVLLNSTEVKNIELEYFNEEVK